ncbi:tetratricopeptide repeat protein [Treponema parvum]|uniref:Tetratricopeptide repeat protein n=1 Tax=Treponema parvum TaxID=138851 RepID=A0A975IBY1_9SPIR|nr:tetratricopeptide repeat protein [Treponema parvum]QTQ11263.1 tetratricopeptide repeat protein [Treponema parvum]
MNFSDRLNTIYYIELPENFEFSGGSLKIDASIPLPVQKKDSDLSSDFNIKELSEEQILSGILTVLAYDRQNKHSDYYRSLIMRIRPEIKTQLSEAAIIKTKNEDFDLADEIFCALRGLDPDDISIKLNYALFLDQRADAYRRLGLNEDADACDCEAEAFYKAVMEAEPPVPDGFFNAGFFYMKKQAFLDAKGCFETYLALTCDIPDNDLGENGIYKKKRSQEILDDIKNRNTDDEKFIAAYELIKNGEEEKALDKIREFLQKNPHTWNAWFMLGWALRRLERYEDAKQAFLKSMECDGGGSNADTYNELAVCYIEEKNYTEAQKCLENALTLDPENIKIMSNLGFLALKTGNPGVAQKYFSAVLEFSPGDKIALAELAKLENL